MVFLQHVLEDFAACVYHRVAVWFRVGRKGEIAGARRQEVVAKVVPAFGRFSQLGSIRRAAHWSHGAPVSSGAGVPTPAVDVLYALSNGKAFAALT